ncbi:MAG TPA: anti-sigma F factor [Firmicutes bacterium]|nr:anti-sigma F factor [Bacillota bacterium]
MDNEMTLEFPSKSQNESFARTAVVAFLLPLDPTVMELNDIRTAVSEAVTNAVIHGYGNKTGKITLRCSLSGRQVVITVKDYGAGIADVEKAREPLFTTRPAEGCGLGFTVMESFMDRLDVISQVGEGTTVRMEKLLSQAEDQHE